MNSAGKGNKGSLKRRMVITLVVIITFISYGFVQNDWIQVDTYHITMAHLPSEFENYKIVQISDTHLPKNAANVAALVALVKEQEPDLILMTGDLVDTTKNVEHSELADLCKGLTEICDVYAVTGNHENVGGNIDGWKRILTQSGVHILRNIYTIIERNGAKLAVMGIKSHQEYSADLFDDIQSIRDMPKIMMAHRPDLWETYCDDTQSVLPDLVLTGHAHGGQFRIPFVGGLIAPDQGWFPRYTSGLYTSGNGVQMIVSRGLGNSVMPFRINNRPHLPVIILQSK